jgi:hypothetical protein
LASATGVTYILNIKQHIEEKRLATPLHQIQILLHALWHCA